MAGYGLSIFCFGMAFEQWVFPISQNSSDITQISSIHKRLKCANTREIKTDSALTIEERPVHQKNDYKPK